MIDAIIACIVIGLPSALALLVLERASHTVPAWRTREQELGAAGMFPAVHATRRPVVSIGVPDVEISTRPQRAIENRGDPLPVGPLPELEGVVAPLATQHP